ncbi:MAG: UPF0489 family protein [Candidatus Pacearchaeota archaeon]|jgi:hypothetical protein
MQQTNSEIIEKLVKRFSYEPRESKRYSYPRQESISEIPTIIVDPHNEVLPFWYLKKSPPATLVHIDKHADTIDGALSLEYLEKKGIVDIVTYAKHFQNPGAFISAAIFYKLIDSVYWINLREDKVIKLGRWHNPDITELVTEINGKLFWDLNYLPRDPPAIEITLEEMVRTISKDKPLILDIDLDAFECIEDKDYKLRKYKSLGLYTLLRKSRGISKRFEVFDKIKQLPKPSRITIARSETPLAYTPKSKVDYLETKVLEELKRIYS